MYNKTQQGAYSQRYSNYLMDNKTPLKDKEAQQGTPLETRSFTVKVIYNGLMGSVNGNGLVDDALTYGDAKTKTITVKSGDSVTITARPKSGYRFVKWHGLSTPGKDANPTLTFNVLSNTSVAAEFAAVDPQPGIGANESVTGPSSGSGSVSGSLGSGSVLDTAKATGIDLKAMLKKYWWVLAAVLVGYYLYKEGKL